MNRAFRMKSKKKKQKKQRDSAAQKGRPDLRLENNSA